MLFKKKKKEENEIEEVVNPFSQIEIPTEEQEVIMPVNNVPIANESNIESINNHTEVGENNNTINKNYNDSFNEIHPVSLAKEEEKISYKDMDVNDLIKDIKFEEYCSNCGSLLNLDADVCFVCGTSIEE